MREIVEAANAYVHRGFNIIPLVYGQKTPALPELEPYFSRRVTRDKIEALFGNGGPAHNIGIITGAISQLIVLDIDGQASESVFMSRLERLPLLCDKLARTFGVTSGKGKHFYLRTDPSEFPSGVDTTVLYKGEGGEIRVKGNRGYVVAPPSVHPSGKPYESNGKELQSITADEWRQLLAAFGTAEAAKTPIAELFEPEYKVTAGNNRHEDLLRVMESLIARTSGILSEEKMRKIAHDWNQEHCEPPLSDEEFERQWHDAIRFIARKQGQGQQQGIEIENGCGKDAEKRDENNNEEEVNHGPKPKKGEVVLELVKESCVELFSDQYQKPFACISVNSHLETLPIGSSNFKHWVAHLYFTKNKGMLSSEDIAAVISTLKGTALFEGHTRHLDVRVAGSGPNEPDIIYYDLCDPNRQCVKLTKAGWTVEQAPILFVRYNNQSSQVMPVPQYDAGIMDRFLELTNIKDPGHRLLVKVFIITLFIPGISKAILDTHGEQGSAKTLLQRMIKSIVDPSRAETLTIPKRADELLQQLNHNYVTIYNNVSKLDDWVSDIFCKAIEGSGASKRMLYTDDDDIIFNFKHCILINGINPVARNADLVDRTISINLERIPKEKRRKEIELLSEFEKIKPQLLGYIFDVLVKVLNQKGKVRLEEYPRLADFAEYGELIARCMRHKDGEFTKAYFKNSKLQT